MTEKEILEQIRSTQRLLVWAEFNITKGKIDETSNIVENSIKQLELALERINEYT